MGGGDGDAIKDRDRTMRSRASGVQRVCSEISKKEELASIYRGLSFRFDIHPMRR